MKKLVIIIASLLLILSARSASAAEETCTEVYGQGIVCGISTEEPKHEPVNTGIADINPKIFAVSFIAASGLLLFVAKRKNKISLS